MNRNQKIAFWTMFSGYCIFGTLMIHQMGAFKKIDSPVGALILVACYLLVALALYIYVKKNPREIDRWFEK
jgi:SNF family Na+-dependent transporter